MGRDCPTVAHQADVRPRAGDGDVEPAVIREEANLEEGGGGGGDRRGGLAERRRGRGGEAGRIGARRGQ
eukprot:766379-Hanusia_phi.AAC.1